MLRLAGRYDNICFIPRTRTPEKYEEKKKIVLRIAERLNRTDKVAHMIGAMSATQYDQKEYFSRVEKVIEIGASYFQVSFIRNESLVNSLRRFAREIIPSFK